MFKNNLNSMDATAATIYKLPDEFKQFRTNVFRNDFNETRQKYGTECKYISIAYNFVSFLNIDIFSHHAEKFFNLHICKMWKGLLLKMVWRMISALLLLQGALQIFPNGVAVPFRKHSATTRRIWTHKLYTKTNRCWWRLRK